MLCCATHCGWSRYSPSNVLLGCDITQVPKRDAAAKIVQHIQLCAAHGDRFGGEYITFSSVSPRVFEDLHVKLAGRHGRLTYFGADSGILLVKMADAVHEIVHTTAIDALRDQAVVMGLSRKVFRVGSPRYYSATGNGNGAAKEPDDGLAPADYRAHSDKFPTFVIEAANSQSLRRVRQAKD